MSEESWEHLVTHLQDLYLKVRGEEGTQCRHTEVTPPVWSTCLQWTKRLRLGMMSKELTVWSDWQLNPCRVKSTMSAERNSSSIASYQEKRKERGKLVTLSLTLSSPKGGTAMSMWMERTRLGQNGWGERSESAMCIHWDSLNPTTLSFSTQIPQQLSHLSSFPSYHALSFQKTLERRKWKYGMCHQDTSLHDEQN